MLDQTKVLYSVESAKLSVKDIQRSKTRTHTDLASRAAISSLSCIHVQKRKSTCHLTHKTFLVNINYDTKHLIQSNYKYVYCYIETLSLIYQVSQSNLSIKCS